MLDQNDLQAIAEIMDSKIRESEERTNQKLDQLKEDLTSYIDEKATTATSHAIAYAEGAIIPKFDLLADAHKLTQEQIADLKKDIDRIDYQLGQHEGKFYLMEQAK